VLGFAALLTTVLLAGEAWAIACDATPLFEDTTPGTPALDNLPVVVHLLQNLNFPADNIADAQKAFSLETIKGYFEASGEFNQIWSKNETGLRFTLVRVEKCQYRIPDRLVSRPEEKRDIPQPTLSGLDWVKRVIDKLNAKTYHVGGTRKTFVGLDVYLVWEMKNASGFGAPFKRPSDGKRGAVWIDRECLDSGSHCARQFAHEVGHFLSLCHLCVLQADVHGGEAPKPDRWCECLDKTQSLPVCSAPLKKCVMHIEANGTDLSDCEKLAVVRNARLAFRLSPP
jgi:hypothetical protein